MADSRQIESLILLVGSNPLPNYLAALALKPKKIHLVYSEATAAPKERLYQALQAELASGVAIDGDVFVEDPFSATAVGNTIRDLMARCKVAHLHYTGGTKVMSAHALKAFCEKGGRPEDASYLDEGKRRLRFDDGGSKSLEDGDVKLKLASILQLHGSTSKLRSRIDGGPQASDIQTIATAVLKRPQLASCLFGEKQRLEGGTFNEAKQQPCNTEPYGVPLSAAPIPADGMSKRCFDAWCKFLGGEWLEDWIGGKIDALALPNGAEIAVGVNCVRAGRPFEVDVAVIRGQRSYFISCTTDMTRDRCKSKAFEILVRAAHMGGDLARSALVSLLPNPIVEDLKSDIADTWGSNNTTRIFGLEDLRRWAGQYGSPDLGDLRTWLDS